MCYEIGGSILICVVVKTGSLSKIVFILHRYTGTNSISDQNDCEISSTELSDYVTEYLPSILGQPTVVERQDSVTGVHTSYTTVKY